jgi:hypothetical protein
MGGKLEYALLQGALTFDAAVETDCIALCKIISCQPRSKESI